METWNQKIRRWQIRSDKIAQAIRPYSVALIFLLAFTGKLDKPSKTFFTLLKDQNPYRLAIYYQQNDESALLTWRLRKIIFFRI